MAKAFDPKADYDNLMEKMKDEFNKKWNQKVVSPSTGLSNYIDIANIGSGGFGKVKLVQEKGTNKILAVKQLSKDDIVRTNHVKHIFSEKRILQSVNFPFLASLKFSTKDNDYLYMGLPAFEGGDLFTYLRKVKKLSERQAKFYAAQIFLALDYLHCNSVVYRDLKPENIMFDNRGYIKIADLGFSKRVTDRTMTLCGTPEYLAPEIIQMKPYAGSVDWWAFGILIYEFLTGQTPFALYNKNMLTMYSQICEGNYNMPSSFNNDLQSFIEGLLQVDMTKRLGCMAKGSKDIKLHDWFKDIDWYRLLNMQVDVPFVPMGVTTEEINAAQAASNQPTIRSRVNRYEDVFAEF